MTGIRLFILTSGLLAGTLMRPQWPPRTEPSQSRNIAIDALAAPQSLSAESQGKSEVNQGASPVMQGTSWHVFYPALPDTITLRFTADSAAVLSPTGVPILQSIYKLKNDVISFRDYGGMNACQDLSGSYHVRINGDTLVLVMDEDPCDARAGVLILKPWIRNH